MEGGSPHLDLDRDGGAEEVMGIDHTIQENKKCNDQFQFLFVSVMDHSCLLRGCLCVRVSSPSPSPCQWDARPSQFFFFAEMRSDAACSYAALSLSLCLHPTLRR